VYPTIVEDPEKVLPKEGTSSGSLDNSLFFKKKEAFFAAH
jgi:hypothetical protein